MVGGALLSSLPICNLYPLVIRRPPCSERQEKVDPKDPMAALALGRLGAISLVEGRPKEGQQLLTRAIAIWASTKHAFDPTDMALAKTALAECEYGYVETYMDGAKYVLNSPAIYFRQDGKFMALV
eukprot:scaffold206789_cov21-Prasinocladus_malaysianus.AAC.1